MTCIVGMETGGTVVLGGDAWTSTEWSGAPLAQPKVWRAGEFVYGCAGSLRAGQVFRHLYDAPPLPYAPNALDIDRYMVGPWIHALQVAMREARVATDEQETPSGTEFLVGVRGCLYVVEADYATWRCARGYHAIGTGSELALGALHALRAGCSGFTPRVLVQLAIASACEHANTVRGPITIVEVP